MILTGKKEIMTPTINNMPSYKKLAKKLFLVKI
jgi:hypothetical protein